MVKVITTWGLVAATRISQITKGELVEMDGYFIIEVEGMTASEVDNLIAFEECAFDDIIEA